MKQYKICYVLTIDITIRAFFVSQLKYLSEHGFDVTVVCSPSEDLQAVLGDGVRYIPIFIARGISPLTLRSSVKKLQNLFSQEKFDMVQYSTPNAAFIASIAAKKTGIKIRNYHLMGFRFLGAKGLLRNILKTLEKITCKNSTHIECVSKSNLELGISERVFSAEKATVVWNGSTGGVDLDRFNSESYTLWRDEIRKQLGVKQEEFLFGFVGRVTRDKGINELISAFLKIESNAKLLICGSLEGIDTLDKTLLQMAQKCPNIIFHDSVVEIEKYYAALDVLVLPSYREGFGNVVIEAAAVGTPAIISNIPGPIDAVISNKTAKLVRPKDAEELKNIMEELVKDRALVCDMAQNAREYVQKSFNGSELNKKIYQRKLELLNANDE